jgi:peptidoglycan/LPS O-acetylase OafA/YrhL
VFASITSGAPDAQGIANNTVSMIVAYLVALASVLATAKLFERFERKPVERPAHRWVVVANDDNDSAAPTESAAAVELPGEEPAA